MFLFNIVFVVKFEFTAQVLIMEEIKKVRHIKK